MAMTEKKARALFCPLLAIAQIGTGGGATPCAGSKCMMWRWQREQPGGNHYRHILCANVSATEEPQRPTNVPPSWTWSPFVDTEGDPAGWTESEEDWRARQQGYCGLAGAERLFT